MLFTSIAICAVILVTMGMQFQKGASVPAIHNISTDVSDPPQFTQAIVELRGKPAIRSSTTPTSWRSCSRVPIRTLRPLQVATAPAGTVQSVVAVLEDMGLEVVTVDEGRGIVEATDTTFWFGFKDDVVVRVRPSVGGSVVDVRSVSRVGLSDLGANAARIMRILDGVSSAG